MIGKEQYILKILYLSIVIATGIILGSGTLFFVSLQSNWSNTHMPPSATPMCETLINFEKGLSESQIDKSRAIALAKNDPQFLTKINGFTIASEEVGESISYNVLHCNNFKPLNVNVAFLIQNGTDRKEIVVLEDTSLNKVERTDVGYVGMYGFFNDKNENHT